MLPSFNPTGPTASDELTSKNAPVHPRSKTVSDATPEEFQLEPLDFRNHLAHVNRKLHLPDSFQQLELCGGLINARFSTQGQAPAAA